MQTSEPRSSPRNSGIVVIDLDELPELRCSKRADKLVITRNAILVIEEAQRITKRDLDQVVHTLESLRSASLSEALSRYIDVDPTMLKPALVLHYRRGVDIIVPKLVAMESKRLRVPIHLANCENQLRNLIDRYSS